MLTSLFSLFYVTGEFHRFLHRGRANVSAILGRKCTARLKVNQNTRSPSLSEKKFSKRMAFSVLGSLRTVPLHSTSAVNNLGLKVCFVKYIIK